MHEDRDLNAAARRIWEANAEWWDDRIGDGNEFQEELLEPTTERLLALQPGEKVLDIGCWARMSSPSTSPSASSSGRSSAQPSTRTGSTTM